MMNNRQLKKAAAKLGTPLYVFDASEFDRRCGLVSAAIGEAMLCYCVKANGFLLRRLPFSVKRLEVCSHGELELCVAAKFKPEKLFISGINKTYEYILTALDYGAETFSAESLNQLRLINRAGLERGRTIDVYLRLTAGDQFGMGEAELRMAVENSAEYEAVSIAGLHYFSGTQKAKAAAIEKELDYLIAFADEIKRDFGFDFQALEYGPGLFADYFGQGEAAELALLKQLTPSFNKAAKRFKLTVELGRFLAASSGTYLTTVVETKENKSVRYVIVDGGGHQIRYDGQLMGLRQPPIEVLSGGGAAKECTICGSLCAIGDRLAQNALLPSMAPGDLLAFRLAGAYCPTEGMALFLSRELPKVALFDGESLELVRDFVQTSQFNG